MAPRPSPYKDMLNSTAYERMRKAHPSEFEPASVFFTHDARSAIDRRNSFRVKAALVYRAIRGHHVDEDDMPRAKQLLLAVARDCHSKLRWPAAAAATATDAAAQAGQGKGAAEGEGAAQRAPQGTKPSAPVKENAEITDDAMDDEHKRVVDAIFLVVGFLPRLMEAIDTCVDREAVDESFKSLNMQDIVTDVIKLENQLPLADLLDVTEVVQDVINNTVASMNFKDAREYKLSLTRKTFCRRVIHGFCWYYSPFFSKNEPAPEDEDVPSDAAVTLLDYLHRSTVPRKGSGAHSTARAKPSRMPAASELRRSGVRLQAAESGRAEVEFMEQWATLRLPALVYDFKLATVARNLLARESCEEQSKPVTRYFQMMNELVEDVADVRILRRAGVVGGGSRGAQEVHELIKNIDGHATYPSVYMAMDGEIEKVRQLHEKRMKNFFVRNRPGVIWASSVAAISVMGVVAARRNRG